MSQDNAPLVEHNAAAKRFEIQDPAGLSQLTYRQREDGTLILVHTEVPPALSGRGLGGELARAALEYARDQKLRVAPDCPFVQSYMTKHPEFESLRA
jgi:uncharacterized protein